MKILFLGCLTAVFLVQAQNQPAQAEGFFDELRDNFTRDLGRAVDAVTRRSSQRATDQYQNNTGQQAPLDLKLTRAEIARLQSGLNALGYNVGVADGVPGPATQRGIDFFLRDRGRSDLPRQPSFELLAVIEATVQGSQVSAPGQTAGSAPVLAAGQASSLPVSVDPASGLPIIQERPAVLSQNAMPELIGSNKKNRKEYNLAWHKLLSALVLGQVPSILNDEDTALGYAATLLSETEKGELFGPGYTAARSASLYRPDEFERRQIAERFRTQYAPGLISRAPKLPYALVEVRDVTLEKYDFEKGYFPIKGYGGSQRGETYATKLSPDGSLGFGGP